MKELRQSWLSKKVVELAVRDTEKRQGRGSRPERVANAVISFFPGTEQDAAAKAHEDRTGQKPKLVFKTP